MIFYKKLKPIKAFTFDLDDTLYDNNKHMPIAEAAFLTELNQLYPETQSVDKTQWRTARNDSLARNPLLKSDMGELRRQTLKQVLQTCGYAGEALLGAVNTSFECFYFHRSNLVVEEKIHILLAALAKRLPLAAITNGNVNLKQIGLEGYFSHIFKADLDLPMKPDTIMFNACKKALNLNAEQILHVGDNLQNDVFGAIRAGYQSAWYAHDRSMELQKEAISLLPHVQFDHLNELLELA